MPDILTPAQRSYCMSRIKAKDTGPELRIRSELHRRGFRFRKHVKDLPGKPDVVFTRARVAVFVDGDFWHGYRFSNWKDNLSEYWRTKITRTRERDAAANYQLEQMGWKVVRLRQHEIEEDFEQSIDRVAFALAQRR